MLYTRSFVISITMVCIWCSGAFVILARLTEQEAVRLGWNWKRGVFGM